MAFSKSLPTTLIYPPRKRCPDQLTPRKDHRDHQTAHQQKLRNQIPKNIDLKALTHKLNISPPDVSHLKQIAQH